MSMEIRQKHLEILKNIKKDGFGLIIFKHRGEEARCSGFQIGGQNENGSPIGIRLFAFSTFIDLPTTDLEVLLNTRRLLWFVKLKQSIKRRLFNEPNECINRGCRLCSFPSSTPFKGPCSNKINLQLVQTALRGIWC